MRRIAAPSGTATAELEVPKSIAQKVGSGIVAAAGGHGGGLARRAILGLLARRPVRFTRRRYAARRLVPHLAELP